MKYLILYIFLVLCVISCRELQTKIKSTELDVPSIEADIKKVLYSQQNAWNDGNLDAFMQGYWKSDSLTFVGSKGLTWGWRNTLDNYKLRYPNQDEMGKLSFEIIKTDVLTGESAILIGRFSLFRKADQLSGIFTLIWKKIDNKWVITSDQTCG